MRPGRSLVTGAAGLLGQWLVRTTDPSSDVVALAHRRAVSGVPSVAADLRDAGAVVAAVAQARPTLVIHAAYADDRPSIVDATRHVVDAANRMDARVLFVSTDAVFLGDGRPRNEQAEPDAVWNYGRWKTAAERIVLDGSDHGTVVRLPLLVSIEPDDHVVQKIRAAEANGTSTRWFTDEHRRPAFAAEIAAAIWRIAALPDSERRGCWHLAGAERLSRFDIACRMVDRLGLPHDAIEPAPQAAGDRPRDIAFTAARARAAIDWDPSPIG